MPIQRNFLGLQRPALQATADFLLERYRRGRVVDLGNVTIVMPASRAGRRLLELLVERCEGGGWLLTPPLIETVGSLPEQLYAPKRPFANALVQELAWTQAARSLSADALRPLLPDPPLAADADRWREIGLALCRQHLELAGDGLNFRDVVRRGGELPGFPESGRWGVMAAIQDAYHRLLDDLGLWDRQTARLVAIRQRECRSEREIILVAAADMNVTLRQMLDAVADKVTALVFAPPEWANRFDEHGCLVPDCWRNVALPISPERTHVVDGPADQAEMVLRCLGRYAGRFRPDEVTIGVPDERLVPDIARVLGESDVPTRWGPGTLVSESGPCRLLAALADYLSRRQAADLAALLRHPDLQSWLTGRKVGEEYLAELDDYCAGHLPYRISGRWLGSAGDSRQLRRAFRAVSKLIEPVQDSPQHLTIWGERLLELLSRVYARRQFDLERAEDRATVTASHEIRLAVEEWQAVPEALAPTLDAADAIGWLLQALEGQAIPAPAAPAAIEMLGWLDLPLDDAPALIITGLNEGLVPQSVSSDLFLPNRLRSQLGLLNNDRRYARDAYALSVMLATRTEVDLIVPRRNHDGDPLSPSRLLLAGDSETTARRAQLLFRAPAASGPHRRHGRRGSAAGGLTVPRPQPLAAPIARLRVTSFRDYLACPYRFYLRHALRLASVEDRLDELDGAAFGSLAHEVLRRWGQSPARHSSDPARIRDVLHGELDSCVAEEYGSDALAVVRVQAEQLRLRLNAFAERQAAWAAEGWRVAHIEVPSGEHEPAIWMVDGEPFELAGRIDRIDVHQKTGQCCVLDYKTSDTARGPREVHQMHSGEWLDLQLPLYRRLLPSLGVAPDARLGYILLPKDTSRVEFSLADWTSVELEEAEAVAIQIIRAIRQEIFWPPTDPPPDFFDEFAAICQDHVFSRERAS